MLTRFNSSSVLFGTKQTISCDAGFITLIQSFDFDSSNTPLIKFLTLGGVVDNCLVNAGVNRR